MQYNRALSQLDDQQHELDKVSRTYEEHDTERHALSSMPSTNLPWMCRADKQNELFSVTKNSVLDSARHYDNQQMVIRANLPQEAERYGILQSITSVPMLRSAPQTSSVSNRTADVNSDIARAVQQLQLPPPMTTLTHPNIDAPSVTNQPSLSATAYATQELWAGAIPVSNHSKSLIEHGRDAQTDMIKSQECRDSKEAIIDEVCTSSQIVQKFLMTKNTHSGQEEKEYVLQLMKQAQTYCEASMRADAHLTEAELYFNDLASLEESLMRLLNDQKQSGAEEESNYGSLPNSHLPSRRESLLLPPASDKAFVSDRSSGSSTPQIAAAQPANYGLRDMHENHSATNSLASASSHQQMSYRGENTCHSSIGKNVHINSTSEDNSRRPIMGTQRVISDIQMCHKLIEKLEQLEPYMRGMELAHTRLQQYFLLHDNEDDSHITNSTFTQHHQHSDDLTSEDKENRSRRINFTTTSTQSATIKERQEAVRELLMDELLLQRREQAAAAAVATSSPQQQQQQQQIGGEHEHRHRGSDMNEMLGREYKTEDDFANTTSTLLIVSVPTLTMSSEFTPSNYPDTKFTTVIASPSRYAQVQLHLIVRLKIETMMARLKSLHARRQCEIQNIEQRISVLDVYDPSISDILTRRDTCTQELQSLQSWLHQLYQLQLRIHNAQLEMDSSLINAARLRRQVLEVLEQRLSEEEARRSSLASGYMTSTSRDSTNTDINDGSVAFSNMDTRSTVLGERPKRANVVLRSNRLTRASTVFRTMLEQLAEQQQRRNYRRISGAQDETDTRSKLPLLCAPYYNRVENHGEQKQGVVAEPREKSPDKDTSVSITTTVDVSVRDDTTNNTIEPQTSLQNMAEVNPIEKDCLRTLCDKRQRAESTGHNNDISSSTRTSDVGADAATVEIPAIRLNTTHDDKSNKRSASFSESTNDNDGGASETDEICEPEEYSMRKGQLLRGFTALFASVIKRAITFSDDDDENDETDAIDDNGNEVRSEVKTNQSYKCSSADTMSHDKKNSRKRKRE